MAATMMILWTLVLGPVGALALMGIALATQINSPVLGIACGIIALSHIVLTMLWGTLAVAQSLQDRQSPVAGEIRALRQAEA
jgi:hypothetical protein